MACRTINGSSGCPGSGQVSIAHFGEKAEKSAVCVPLRFFLGSRQLKQQTGAFVQSPLVVVVVVVAAAASAAIGRPTGRRNSHSTSSRRRAHAPQPPLWPLHTSAGLTWRRWPKPSRRPRPPSSPLPPPPAHCTKAARLAAFAL